MTASAKSIICLDLELRYPKFRFEFYPDEEWGNSIFIYTKDGGCGQIRMYWYNDDLVNIYLEDLHVDENSRSKGIGRSLIDICESACIYIGGISLSLWVDGNSWMKDWYRRIGYEYLIDCKDDKDYVWVKRNLI